MFNIIPSCFLSTWERSPKTHFLGNDQTEVALITWLKKQGCDTLPDSLFATASVLFAWVDSHDLMAFLDVSLREVTMRKWLQQEEQPMFFPGGVRCLMQDRMLQAQMEVLLFSNAIANACEELETRSHTDTHTTTVRPAENVGACLAPSLVRLGCFQPSNDIVNKCNTWLLVSSYSQHTTKVNVNWEFDSPHTLGPEYLPISKDTFLFLPAFLKAWVNQITYCTYMSASLAETKPPHLNTRHSFKAKDSKNLDVLRSEIHILDLKKHHAQTEVDMLSEATSCIAESEAPSDSSDGSSGSAVTYECDDDWSDDWFLSLCASSNASEDMEPCTS
ncbi:hypothetical protein EDD22DRAFT_962723 [Suillus occidentalis]|nr:hypothetical protein EDD22DRAFT_962723 [Suillus occidentalis]